MRFWYLFSPPPPILEQNFLFMEVLRKKGLKCGNVPVYTPCPPLHVKNPGPATGAVQKNKCIASSGASLPKASGKSQSVEHF